MKTKRKLRKLVESYEFDSKVDLSQIENGLIKNVKIVGLHSRHGYDYAGRALREAVPLYEGIAVNIDHPARNTPDASRSYRDRFGRHRNVHFVEGDGLRADFHFNPKHLIAPQFIWDAKNDPAACGFSHNARGPLTERTGKKPLCESIEAVRSVDLVADAATTRSLYEGKATMKIRKRKPERLSRREVKRALVESYGRHKAALLLEALDPAAAQGLAAEPAPTGSGSDDAVWSAFKNAINGVLDDDSMDLKATLKRIGEILKAYDKLSAKPADPNALPKMEGAGPEDDEDDSDDDEPETSKGRKGKTRMESGLSPELETRLTKLEKRERRLEVRELCESMTFRPTDKQMELLMESNDEDYQTDLIESWQEASPVSRRKVSSGARSRDMLESEGPAKEYKDAADWAKGLT